MRFFIGGSRRSEMSMYCRAAATGAASKLLLFGLHFSRSHSSCSSYCNLVLLLACGPEIATPTTSLTPSPIYRLVTSQSLSVFSLHLILLLQLTKVIAEHCWISHHLWASLSIFEHLWTSLSICKNPSAAKHWPSIVKWVVVISVNTSEWPHSHLRIICILWSTGSISTCVHRWSQPTELSTFALGSWFIQPTFFWPLITLPSYCYEISLWSAISW